MTTHDCVLNPHCTTTTGCGRGISVTQNVDDLRKAAESQDTCIVSSYISNPLLIEGKKVTANED